jgi:hypothetical protein
MLLVVNTIISQSSTGSPVILIQQRDWVSLALRFMVTLTSNNSIMNVSEDDYTETNKGMSLVLPKHSNLN